MLADDRHAGLANRLERALVGAFREAGWDVESVPDGEADFIAHRGDERFVAELKVTARPTRPTTEAMLANAVLVARRAARERGARALAIVGAERISRRTATELNAFAGRYIDRTIAYGWIDSRGTLELHGSAALEEIRGTPSDDDREGAVRPRRHAVFSDLGQWLLKVLLAPRLPADLLTAPRDRPQNVRQLAHIAGVSEPTAHRVVTAAKEAGLIREDKRGVEIVDPMRLLRRWRSEGSSPAWELPATWIVRKREALPALEKALRRVSSPVKKTLPSACLGLFAAARGLELGFVQGVPPHVLMRAPSQRTLEALGLRAAEPRDDVDVFVRHPVCPESTFRGCVRRGDIWLTDVIQTWLDTSQHPARGQEQAEHIERHVLAPAFGGEDR